MIPGVGEPITYAAIGAVVTGVGFVLGIVVKVMPFVNAARDFFSDWNGEPARPGVPERQGVMARLAVVETMAGAAHVASDRAESSARQAATVANFMGDQLRVVITAVSQLLPNHGTSLRDSVDRIERDLATVTWQTLHGGNNV